MTKAKRVYTEEAVVVDVRVYLVVDILLGTTIQLGQKRVKSGCFSIFIRNFLFTVFI